MRLRHTCDVEINCSVIVLYEYEPNVCLTLQPQIQIEHNNCTSTVAYQTRINKQGRTTYKKGYRMRESVE